MPDAVLLQRGSLPAFTAGMARRSYSIEYRSSRQGLRASVAASTGSRWR